MGTEEVNVPETDQGAGKKKKMTVGWQRRPRLRKKERGEERFNTEIVAWFEEPEGRIRRHFH